MLGIGGVAATRRGARCGNQHGVHCPRCGTSEGIKISASVAVMLCQDGTDIDGRDDTTWDDDSPAWCTASACGWRGRVVELRDAHVCEAAPGDVRYVRAPCRKRRA